MAENIKYLMAKVHSALRRSCGDAELCFDDFTKLMRRCDLGKCKGMCCYDGVYLDRETEDLLQFILKDQSAWFRQHGIDPSRAITDGQWNGKLAGRKTATIPYEFSSAVSNYPHHFNDTSCVFRMMDGKCALQVLAMEQKLHPWSYKPSACWLHPIHIDQGRIRIYDKKDDPYRSEDYPGFQSWTTCGAAVCDGQAAYIVLAAELTYLSEILGKELLIDFEGDLGR